MSAGTLPSRASFTLVDACVWAAILALCTIPFVMIESAPDFINSDVHYVNLALSLSHSHTYASNFTREGIQPPGLPLILAGICGTLGCSHNALTRWMPVFLGFGLVLAYEVVRRLRGRLVAAIPCVVMAASPVIFPWVTSRLWPTFPYLLVSMAIFLLLPKIDEPAETWPTVWRALALAVLLTAAVLIESISLSLILAIIACVVWTSLEDIEKAKRRLKILLPALAIASVIEVWWLHRGGNRVDWPLPGWPAGYLAQVGLKNGNYPEQGFATLMDWIWRIDKNAKDTLLFLVSLVIDRWFDSSWTSPILMGLLVLMLCGLWRCVWREETRVCAIYFMGFESIYLAWPWFTGVLRFAVEVLPFEFMFLSEGVFGIREWLREYPRRVGVVCLSMSAVLAAVSIRLKWMEPGHGAQEKIAAPFWIVSATAGAILIWGRTRPRLSGLTGLRSLLRRRFSIAGTIFGVAEVALVVVATILVGTGVAAEIPMARENLTSGMEKFDTTPEIIAARWVKAHTAPDDILAASQASLIYYYSKRKLIWFPPISKPSVVMEGIRKYHIRYIVVISRRAYYYYPSEVECFRLLSDAYPGALRLVDEEGPVRIYEVLPAPAGGAETAGISQF